MTSKPTDPRSGAAQDTAVRELKRSLVERYDVTPADVALVRSPYRICPLGAHIDHQLGSVTAMAIDRGVLLAYAPTDSREVRLSSLSYPGEVRFALDDVPPSRPHEWGNFPRGAVAALTDAGHRLDRGMVGITSGSLAEGGLSSSAAVGVAYLLALEHLNELTVSPEENVALDQAIENGYLGLRNGILDQSAILLSRRDHLTRIDCRNVSHELFGRGPDAAPFAILIAFSGLRQALVSTDYNLRVEECATAARQLLAACGRPRAKPLLGDISHEEYATWRTSLSGPSARRAAHFFSECERVERGVEAWRADDLALFGQLMTASGESSISQYECGAPPLIDLYGILVETPGVYGARFSGAGFRGCCVALVEASAATAAARQVGARYAECQPDLAVDAPVLICSSADGARVLVEDGPEA